MLVKDAIQTSLETEFDVVSPGATPESWEFNLPADLRVYQGELELLLGKVFSGRPRSPHNIELAQQMTMNWCMSKRHKISK